MTRRETKPARRERPEGKSSGLFLGLVIGLVIGLVVAAGLAWHFNKGGSGFKPVDDAPAIPTRPDQSDVTDQPAEPVKVPAHRAHKEHAAARVVEDLSAKAAKADKHATSSVERKTAAANEPPSRVPLTFYGILPGDKPAKPVEPPKSSEVWWLQIAALKNPADADKLKARLILLGLVVSTQQVDSAGQTLYRVRVGPYKRDEDAFADLDTLSTNNYEPRLLKEPPKGVQPP